MSFGLTSKDIDEILNGKDYFTDRKEECPQCDKGYFARDTNGEKIAWIDGGRFMIQEFDEQGPSFIRKFDIKYCPYCGRELNNRRKAE